MAHLIWLFISNPMTLLVVAGLILLFVGCYFTLGPVRTLKMALDPRLWLVAIVAAGALGYSKLASDNKKLEDKVAAVAPQNIATEDATKIVRERAEHRQKRQSENDHIKQIIDRAQPGQAEDDVLDEISNLQGRPVAKPAIRIEPQKPVIKNETIRPPQPIEKTPAPISKPLHGITPRHDRGELRFDKPDGVVRP